MISKDEIIRMGVETGIFPKWKPADSEIEAAERFASMIAAYRQEQCDKVCEEYSEDQWNLYKGRPPYDGSESGRADPDTQCRSDVADHCAAAIRAMK